MVKIDTKDRRILTELDMDARMPFTQLAKKVGLSRQVVEYRIKRMQKEEIIFGALAIFDSVVAGFNWYRVLVRLLKVNKEEKDRLISTLKNNEKVMWLGEVGGNWDLVVNFVCRDNFEFNSVFEKLSVEFGSFIRDYEILVYMNVTDLERSYLLSQEKVRHRARKEFFHEMKYNSKLILDGIDWKIIRKLSSNAWKTNIEIAKSLGMTSNTIRNRISIMKKNKLILGYRLFINPQILGFRSHMLFLEITKLDTEREKELFSFLKGCENITFLVKHMGKYRIGMEIETETEEKFQEIFVDIRGRFSDIITGFESFPLFKDHAINYFPAEE